VTILDTEAALSIVEAAHSAWNAADLEGMIDCYVDDLVSVSNMGPDGSLLVMTGKDEFRSRFVDVMQLVDSKTHIESFHFDGVVARVRFSVWVQHRKSGHTATGTYRELCTFRDGRIARIEDFHDAPKMSAFWRLIEREEALANAGALG
jgi:ketosteroid isomerase-like protein